MKRAIILTIILTTLLSTPVYAYPKYDAETEKLMREAGLQVDYDVDAIMQRQEAYKAGKANDTTLNTQNGQEKASSTTTKRIKGGFDEYRVQGGNNSVQVTDTEDDLHIYSNNYNNPSGYSKYSNDEFRISGQDTKANDRYSEDSFDQLHIDKMYQDRLWYPSNKVQRMGIDEFRLPNDPVGW